MLTSTCSLPFPFAGNRVLLPVVVEHLADVPAVELLGPVCELHEELDVVILDLVLLVRQESLSYLRVPIPVFMVVTPVTIPVAFNSPVVPDLDESPWLI